MKQLILVTGGAGFIGSHLVDALLLAGHKVIVYDNFDEYYSGKETNIKYNFGKENFKLMRADILDYESLATRARKVDVIFHLAAQPGVRYSMKNPAKTTMVNVLGTLNVLRSAKEACVKRVIVASSSSVYGNPKYMPVDENHPTNPISVYGLSKLAAEAYCKLYYRQFNLPIVVLRYFTVYGPRQRPDMAFYRWARQIFEGKPITIYGDGTQTRDFTYIADVIDATIKAAEIDEIEGEIFNIGGGSRVSINDAVKSLIEISEVDDVQIRYEPPKLGDVKDTHADISKARRLLGFKPNVGLEEGLRNFVEWYKQRFLAERSGINDVK